MGYFCSYNNQLIITKSLYTHNDAYNLYVQLNSKLSCHHIGTFCFIDTVMPKYKTFDLQTTNRNPINIQITRGMCVFGATLFCCSFLFMILVVVTATVLAVVMYSRGHMDMQIVINGIRLQFSAIQRDYLPSEIL